MVHEPTCNLIPRKQICLICLLKTIQRLDVQIKRRARSLELSQITPRRPFPGRRIDASTDSADDIGMSDDGED